MPLRMRRHAYSLAAIVALVGAAGILAFLVVGSGVEAPRPPGLVHSTEIKIAPEISGRLARFAVQRGEDVHQGDTLVELSNPELSASLVLATAQFDEAKAARDRVYAGIRQEQVAMLAREIEVARGNVTYAEQEYSRVSILAKDGFASHQQLDEVTAALDTARAKLAEAEKIYEAAHTGPIKEALAVADTQVEAAAAAVSVIAARVAKLRISAPTDGVIAQIVAEPGEAVIPDQPVMTLEAAGQRWVSFNLREDQFGDLGLGSPVKLMPASGGDAIDARVTEMVPRGEFATWRAARVVGDHDLNTFLVRVDPTGDEASGLQPGMTTWLLLASRPK
jgi:multidrug resistance efflux pump